MRRNCQVGLFELLVRVPASCLVSVLFNSGRERDPSRPCVLDLLGSIFAAPS